MAYSACSSFAALSGNSDIDPGFTGQTTPAARGMEESSGAGDGGLDNEGGSRGRGGSSRNKKGKKKGKGSKHERAESKGEYEADQRQPIDRLLKVTTFLQKYPVQTTS